MKKLSSRDWAIAIVIAVLSAITTFAVTSMYYNSKEPITIESPINEALKKHSDSLTVVIAMKDSLWRASEKQDRVTDSILINNNKVIKKDYGKLKEMDDSTFYNYLKSRFGAR